MIIKDNRKEKQMHLIMESGGNKEYIIDYLRVKETEGRKWRKDWLEKVKRLECYQKL